MKKFIAVFAVLMLLGAASPALAWGWSSSDITVTNNNSAYVKNDVDTTASTGGNDANGGNGGGGFGNDGGNGGAVVTGNAGALSSVYNDVNYNETEVRSRCGCKGDITVTNNNDYAKVKNYVDTKAKTGYNDANGGDGGGGFGNDGGDGGAVVTGDAGAASGVENYVNTNITRVRR